MGYYLWYLAVGACVALLAYTIIGPIGRREAFLPPGPPTLPVLGNLHQLPAGGIERFLAFTAWAGRYGGIFSLKLGPRTAVVLTDRRLVRQLLDRRSALYSDRAPSFVAHELGLAGDLSLQMRHGPTWRRVRRVLNEHIKEVAVERRHVPMVEAEGSQLLRDMMMTMTMTTTTTTTASTTITTATADPSSAPPGRFDHMEHARRYSSSIAFSVIWGLRCPDVNTPHMRRVYEVLDDLGELLVAAGRVPVDLYPALRWLLPRRCFRECRRLAARLSEKQVALYGSLMAQLMRARGAGTEGEQQEQQQEQQKPEVKGHGSRARRVDTLMDRVLDEGLETKYGFTPSQMYGVGVGPIEGASHTTSAVILAAMQAWTRWPETQHRAWAEIDAVVGRERSPVWADYESLPYVAATVKEAMRWRPAGPLAFPHALTQDDWIDGYKIPKGSSVILNTWGLHHDETYFPDSDRFEPARFLGVTTLATKLAQAVDPETRDHYGYGAGRRICPGMHLAERSLFVALAKLLWAFEFAPGRGGEGEGESEGGSLEVDTDPLRAYGMHLIMCAKDYPLRLKVRDEDRRETILREYETAERNVFPLYAP